MPALFPPRPETLVSMVDVPFPVQDRLLLQHQTQFHIQYGNPVLLYHTALLQDSVLYKMKSHYP